MANNCLDTRLLSYNGTSQPQRALDALIAKAAQVDERQPQDLILLTKKYSAWLNYYNLNNTVTGDWQQLMSNDVAVAIAYVADWDTKDYAPFIKYLNDKIVNAATDADAMNNFKILFDFVFSVTAALDAAYKQLSGDIDYYTFLSVSVSSKLAAPLSILFQYYNTFKTTLPLPLIDPTSTLTDPLTPVDQIVLSQNFDITLLSAPFIVSPAITPFPITLSGVVHPDIDHILTHNLFTGALQAFIDAVINIVSRTPAYLAQTLSNYPAHTPHYALYLTFLNLFGFAQTHLNKYTKKHLDFYYKQVLLLSNNAAVADDVHLVFELQKNIQQHLLPKGTSFKAGKDANNNDLFYALTADLVVQTAQVQALKSIYLNKDNAPVTLFASPVANSEDGQGGKLLSADNSWFPFGNPKKIQPAAIGFAIASNVLYLNEGTRAVKLLFTCVSLAGISSADLSGLFNIQLTGKKNWYTVNSYTAVVIDNTHFSLSFTLEGDAPAIVPYSTKIHGGNFTELLPMVQVMLTAYTSYQKIKIPRISSVTISVTVGNITTGDGSVKNLSLQNDDGKINSAKPFKPFGDFPDDGASFIIGSKEILQKSLTALSINFDWQPPIAQDTSGTTALSTLEKALTASSTTLLSKIHDAVSEVFLSQTPAPPDPNVKISALAKGNWSALTGLDKERLLGTTMDITTGVGNVVKSPADFTPNVDYMVTSVDGFIKLTLIGHDYSLSTFLNKIPPPSVSATTAGTVTTYKVDKAVMPVPDPPVSRSISVTYSASDTIAFTDTANAFEVRSNFYYHIEPFGYREMHPFITNDALTLLPVFDLDDGTTNDDGGELWIGLSNALADETFSILFEVSDGSANPLKNMTTVSWYYLNNNNWLPFKTQAVTDQTNNLTSSGLVIVNVPGDATLTNTRADSNLIWIKAVVQKDTDAICNLIAVDTNAGEAQFVQNIANNIEFTKILPPNTISKPAVADAALKKTQQPYPSFDGRIRETDDQFYIRVSERLRHKHRAITTWDYERLTLQYYPQIFKVKCINHTGFILDENTNEQKYAETLAGQVMVITIPDLTHLNTANILRPYTSIGLLTEIQKYLATLTSPFVKLWVVNPQFEEVQFDFEVTFRENFDPIFFTGQLNDEIEKFLTPWAYGNPQAIQFGNTIEKSVVLNFVEERYYVDFVTCFTMNQIILRDGAVIKQALYDIDEAVASTARSILVSYYNEETKVKHLINSPANCDCNG
jgi:hypothetical protein